MASYVSTFTGDGSEVHFTAGFPVLRLTDLAVVVDNVWLTLGTDYSVSGPTSAALATLAVAPGVGAVVTLRSAVGYTPTDPAAVTTAAPMLNETDTALWAGIGSAVSVEASLRSSADAAEAYGRAAADAAIIASGATPADVSSAPVIATGTVQAVPVDAREAREVWIEDFGDAGSGDWTTILGLALTFLDGAGGGTLRLGRRTYLVSGKVLMPYTGTLPPLAKNIRIIGSAAHAHGAASSTVPEGTVLDMRYAGDTHARLDCRGLGLLEIAGVTFADLQASPSTTPFIQTTGTTLRVHDCAFFTKQGGTSCAVDAIVFGGDRTSSGTLDDNINAPFQGYGSVIRDNMFFGIRRVGYLRTFANNIVIRDNAVWNTCGSNLAGGSAFEIVGHPINSTSANVIEANLIEMSGYPYALNLGDANGDAVVGNVFAHNGLWDPVGGVTLGGVRNFAGSQLNMVITGFGGDSFTNGDLSGTDYTKNTLITAHQAVRSYLPHGMSTPTLELDAVASAPTFSLRNGATARKFNLIAGGSGGQPQLEITMTPDGGSAEYLMTMIRGSAGTGYVDWTIRGATRSQLLGSGELFVKGPTGGAAHLGTEDGTGKVVSVGYSGGAKKLSFHGETPISRPVVNGSRGGNVALENLLTALHQLGLITNSTS